MAAEGQEIPEEIKADEVPAQEGGDDEVGVVAFQLPQSTLCSALLAPFFNPCIAYFFFLPEAFY